MKTEAFKQEFGDKAFQNLFAALKEISKYSSGSDLITLGNHKYKISVDFKNHTAFGTCRSLTDLTSYDFELTFGKHGEAVTYFHNNNALARTKEITSDSKSNTKKCTCNWSFLHSNNGCKCGAITPYKPKY